MSNWIFLRGLTREARHWGDFPATLKAAVPDADIVLPDLPGNGEYHHQPSPTNVRGMVEWFREELLRRGIAPPYHLLGLSLGAMVTVEWATRYPEELLPCVLINTSMRPFSPFYRRLRPRNYLRLFALAALPGDARQIETAIVRLTSARFEPQPGVLDAWVACRDHRPVSVVNALRQLVAAARYRAPKNRPNVPLLILAGAKDDLVDPHCSLQLSTHWNTPLRIQKDAGHDLPLDDGSWVALQIQQWLSGHAPPIAAH